MAAFWLRIISTSTSLTTLGSSRLSMSKLNPHCVVCNGTGRIDCRDCSGRGRTNQVHLAMLPKREWPKWCKICGGSGLNYCSCCLGDGKYRETMGFRFMKMDSVDDARSHKNKSE